MNKNIVLGLGKIQSIFINPYAACNNNCTYCAIGDTNQLDLKINQNVLRHHSEKALEFLRAIKDELEDECQFIFLGGEPLLAWHSWLIPFIAQLYTINPKFKYRLSTNATLLTSEKYEDIEKYQIDLNISLDGPKRIHNLNRKLISGAGCFDLAYNNFLKIPQSFSHLLHPCSTIHLNTVQYLPEIFQFMIDTYEIRPFNWFTMNQTDGYEWKESHFKLFKQGMLEIKKMLPKAKFNYNFIPNPPRNQNLIINFNSGLVSVKSNETANPVVSNIANITKENGMLFEDKLQEYRKYHLNKKEKRVLPLQELCAICPGKEHYCIRKEKDFFNEHIYIDLKNFCTHNFILNQVFEGDFYAVNERKLS